LLKTHTRFVALLLGMVLIAGCQGSGRSASREEIATAKQLSVPDTTLPIQNLDVRVSSMDVLEISVFSAPDLSGSYQVDYLGKLKLPLLGTLKAAGYTPAELAANLEQRLAEKYLEDPDVTVRVSDTKKRYLTIDGSVQKPGMYPVDGQLTLLQAVSLSGGPTEGANPNKVVIFRQIEGKRNAAGFNLKDIREGKAVDPLVYPNDIIVMDGSEARRTYGDILRSLPLLTFLLLP
jgi:polysaccharide biosynthesis/export protein